MANLHFYVILNIKNNNLPFILKANSFIYFFSKDVECSVNVMCRPDMKMLEMPEYALYEIHESGEAT